MRVMIPSSTVTPMERPFRGSRPEIFVVLMNLAKRTRFLVEINGAQWVRPERGCWAGTGDRRLQHCFYGCAFVTARHAAEEFVPRYQRGDRKCNGPLRNVIQRNEAAIEHFLFPAHLIKFHDFYGNRIVQVGGRIIEGEMSISTDTEQNQIDGSLGQHRRIVSAC